MVIFVILSDWCPACLEYKIVLNKIISEKQIDIKFAFPQETKVQIRSIPTTFFVYEEKVLKFEEGYLSFNEFMDIYNDLLKKLI